MSDLLVGGKVFCPRTDFLTQWQGLIYFKVPNNRRVIQIFQNQRHFGNMVQLHHVKDP